jgi:hypothetical protein
MKYLPVPVQKLNIVLMCPATNGAILRSTEHIKTLRGPVFGNIRISPKHFMIGDI